MYTVHSFYVYCVIWYYYTILVHHMYFFRIYTIQILLLHVPWENSHWIIHALLWLNSDNVTKNNQMLVHVYII